MNACRMFSDAGRWLILALLVSRSVTFQPAFSVPIAKRHRDTDRAVHTIAAQSHLFKLGAGKTQPSGFDVADLAYTYIPPAMPGCQHPPQEDPCAQRSGHRLSYIRSKMLRLTY